VVIDKKIVPALEIKDLKKVYRNGLEALKKINLTVMPGDFYALLGKNGAGKSTTIGVLTSLIKKTSGEIYIDGLAFEQNLLVSKLKIGVVPQEFNFNAFEKVENILINQALYYGVGINTAKQRAELLLKKMDLWHKKNVGARQLSGGMKRRMMIARALMHSPSILILDEPTAGVDIEIRQAMWQFLKEENQKGLTIILTTHYLEEAEQLCNKVAIIDQGEIKVDTTKRELLKQLEQETLVLQICGQTEDLNLSGAEYVIRKIDDQHLEIDLSKTQSLQSVVMFFKSRNIEIYRAWSKSNRLEQLFMGWVDKKN